MCKQWPKLYGGSASNIGDDCKHNNDFAHCRKPYPEMAYRSLGERACLITSIFLNVMLYGVSIVYLLLSAKIISDFLATAFDTHIGQCKMLIIVAISFLPITFLKSPQDFWLVLYIFKYF